MSETRDDLAELWRWFREHQFRGYSPIYERITDAIVDDQEVLDLFRSAPPAAHLPLAPLGAVRYLLLDGLDHPLGDVYRGTSDADPGPLFVDLCRAERDRLLELLETRRVQTNDCGRAALIGPALTWVAQRLPAPHCVVDVGASAGLTLLSDRYRIDYGTRGATGPADSPVQLSCEVTGGDPPIADRLPRLEQRLGIDLSPIDLADPDDARWLLACVWPDTGRAERVEASIRLAQQDLPTVIPGRAGDVLPDVLADLPAGATAIVTTTWAFGYFSAKERIEFVDLLAAASQDRPIAWLSAENGGTVDAVSAVDPDGSDDASVMGVLLFDGGVSTTHLLARVHPHGNWIDWLAPP